VVYILVVANKQEKNRNIRMTREQNEKISLFEELLIKGQIYNNVSKKKKGHEKLNYKFIIKQSISKYLTSFVFEIIYKNQTVILTKTDRKSKR
jgi:hypothetical protein